MRNGPTKQVKVRSLTARKRGTHNPQTQFSPLHGQTESIDMTTKLSTPMTFSEAPMPIQAATCPQRQIKFSQIAGRESGTSVARSFLNSGTGFSNGTGFRASLVALITVGLVGLAPLSANAQDDDDDFEEDLSDDLSDNKVKKGGPPPADTKPPSKTLERAVDLYKKEQYFSASIELGKVLDGSTGDEPAKKQLAEFFLGKTLYQLEFYAAALGRFDQIVEQGSGHRYKAATLKWLAALARVLPETSGILDKIGQYDPADLEQPELAKVRNELYYLLGRHFYRQGRTEDFAQAVTLFQSVGRDSEWFVPAKFYEAVTYVRQLKGKPATDALKEILVIGQEQPKQYRKEDIEQFSELAEITMARIFYTTRQYDTSIKYYEKINQDSPEWLNSLFEASWAYFMKTRYSKALGNIHTLNAPYFENQYFPESILLKAVMYYFYCQYDRAEEAIAEYDAKYQPLIKDLENILKKHEDNADFYNYVTQILDGKAGLPEDTQRLVVSVLNDKTVAKTLNWVDELDREIGALKKAEKAWQTTNIANQVEQELDLQRSIAESDAGKLARSRITRLRKELKEFGNNGLRVLVEIEERRAGKAMLEATGNVAPGKERQEPIVVDDEHFMWKFDGEYWKDELGFYRFKIKSVCPAKGAPAKP